ncbi:transposase family protein [Paenibacillus alkaliterrae]|nr:transposase family protein [Paenibacillus alkaliterrae]MCF2941752.1 transposase family protein [Paenibacillus alkaliterrae]
MNNERYQGTFFEYFSDMNDPRQEGKVYHRLTGTYDKFCYKRLTA